MKHSFLYRAFVAGFLFGGLVFAAPSGPAVSDRDIEKELDTRGPTCNTATNRACWMTSPAFNINTDYEASWPTTGVTTRSVGFTNQSKYLFQGRLN
jgi:hypothetical protein